MKIEWDPKKAQANLRKHKVSFEEAATVLSDPMAVTGGDPDHSVGEFRYITFGMSEQGCLLVVAHTEQGETIRIISSALQAKESGGYMKKDRKSEKNELRPEYERSDFTGTLVRGKYAKRLRESSNVVVLKPEVAAVFPNGEAVNTALNSLIELVQATTRLTRRSSGRATTRR